MCVFYVCSNLVLARQNKERLAGFLPEAERDAAIATVDRPSLLPIRDNPTNRRLWLFSLSPCNRAAYKPRSPPRRTRRGAGACRGVARTHPARMTARIS